ncbi:receptor-interacting serine/threonine-protein kinase 3-like isoform X1 [Rhineura floridana]|uniref:receptor-interacting serine/threonine-protein kinase 3-like isoform X1 n=1 Tax=Rhineura floridana TaxID=261503 RepID=UPI002AC7FCBE|nr:receptor-interacting serine/threonine-protein kinase 3-like isoform X1 [Rhineura floridana]XP_061443999.1 receptor-interacting serine/threonine-protein kinase 3-like isoform X1 [Rhineura floridana]
MMAGPNKFYEEITSEQVKDFRLIGQGAFGTVYQARHQDWGIDVAVKIPNSNTSFTREELLQEARAMDEARFTYILRLFGLFVGEAQVDAKVLGFDNVAGPRLGLVMEFMENGTLSTLTYRVPSMPWALRVRILHQVALGMNFLHSLSPPLLHLDLKPSNVLLDGELHVRVADFGLSKFKRGTTRHDSLTSGEENAYGGTLEFMPPEAFTDVNYKPTPGADVYSYGILMWSLLTNEDPYSNVPPGNVSSIIKKLIPQGQRPSTEVLEKMINKVWKVEDLIGMMKWCWHHDKTQRPSFRDCSQKTEVVYSYYKPQIMGAVRQVQDSLVRMESSLSKETRVNSGLILRGASSAHQIPELVYQPPLTSSSGLEERFATFHLTEPPSRQNEAVPRETFFKRDREGKCSGLQRSRSACIRKGAQGPGGEMPHNAEVKMRNRTGPTGDKPRPLSDTYPFPPRLPYHFGFQHYPQSFYSPHQEVGFLPPHQDVSWDHSLLPHFSLGAPQGHGGGIHITGHDISGLQVGDYNSMYLKHDPEKPRKQH